jgi:hypothetical protein
VLINTITFDELFDLACDSEIKLEMDLTNATEAHVSPITNNLRYVDDNIQMESDQFEILGETFKEKVKLVVHHMRRASKVSQMICNIN